MNVLYATLKPFNKRYKKWEKEPIIRIIRIDKDILNKPNVEKFLSKIKVKFAKYLFSEVEDELYLRLYIACSEIDFNRLVHEIENLMNVYDLDVYRGKIVIISFDWFVNGESQRSEIELGLKYNTKYDKIIFTRPDTKEKIEILKPAN